MLDERVAKYVGIPFELYGESFDTCDCLGIIRLFYREELGLEIGKYLHYWPPEIREKLLLKVYESEHFVMLGVETDDYQLQVYDIVAIAFNDRLYHLGIYVGDNKILHASQTGKGSVVEQVRDGVRRRIKYVFRHQQFCRD